MRECPGFTRRTEVDRVGTGTRTVSVVRTKWIGTTIAWVVNTVTIKSTTSTMPHSTITSHEAGTPPRTCASSAKVISPRHRPAGAGRQHPDEDIAARGDQQDGVGPAGQRVA
jgi:hypothetical protein